MPSTGPFHLSNPQPAKEIGDFATRSRQRVCYSQAPASPPWAEDGDAETR